MPDYLSKLRQKMWKKWPALAHTTKKPNIETTSRAVTDEQSAAARLFCYRSLCPDDTDRRGFFIWTGGFENAGNFESGLLLRE
jgi:hypothetical protein